METDTMREVEEINNYLDTVVHTNCDYSVYSELKDLVSNIEVSLHQQLQKAREETTEEIIADYMEALGTVQLPQEVWLWIADINGKYFNKSLKKNI